MDVQSGILLIIIGMPITIAFIAFLIWCEEPKKKKQQVFQIEIETLNKTETKSIAEDQAQKLFSQTLIRLLKQNYIRSITKF